MQNVALLNASKNAKAFLHILLRRAPPACPATALHSTILNKAPLLLLTFIWALQVASIKGTY